MPPTSRGQRALGLIVLASLLACGARSPLEADGDGALGGAGAGGPQPASGGGPSTGGGAPIAICGNGVVEPDEACDVAIDARRCDAACNGRQPRTLAVAPTQVIAVRDSRVARIWGTNFFGTFGAPAVPNVVIAPTDLPIASAVEVSAYFGACVLDGIGTPFCAGPNNQGQLGIPPSGDSPVFTYGAIAVPASSQVAIGGEHGCALSAEGTVYCWGVGNVGQVDGHAAASWSSPVALPLSDVVEICASDLGSCARDRAGAITCWGNREAGLYAIALPVAHELTCAATTHCARIAGGDVACWGYQGGHFRASPEVVEGVHNLVRLGQPASGHTCGVDADGVGICWGSNAFGELGRGTDSEAIQPPAPVTVLTGLSEIVASAEATCARLRDGRIACWGKNQNGVLGIPDGAFTSGAFAEPQFIAGFP